MVSHKQLEVAEHSCVNTYAMFLESGGIYNKKDYRTSWKLSFMELPGLHEMSAKLKNGRTLAKNGL